MAFDLETLLRGFIAENKPVKFKPYLKGEQPHFTVSQPGGPTVEFKVLNGQAEFVSEEWP